MSRLPSMGVAAWRWIAVVAAVVAVAAIGFAVLAGDEPDAAPASAPSSPCADMNPHQQVVGDGHADSTAVARTDFSPLPRLSLAGDGVCMDASDELYTRGWEVTRVDLAAQQGGERWAATVAPDTATPLYVPRTGCLNASWVYHLRGPGDVTGTWTVKNVLGVRCATYDARTLRTPRRLAGRGSGQPSKSDGS